MDSPHCQGALATEPPGSGGESLMRHVDERLPNQHPIVALFTARLHGGRGAA